MSRQRHQEYVGRHRIRATSSHRRDGLPPPDPPLSEFPPRTAPLPRYPQPEPPRLPPYPRKPARTAPSLMSTEPWSDWYDPKRMRGIDPDIVSPVRTEPIGRMPEPAKRVNTRNITALTVTFIVGVPALLCAGWVMHDNQLASTTVTKTSQPAPETKEVPVNMVIRGKPVRICMTLTSSGSMLTAWQASDQC